jgi:hypothetical protein
VAEQTVVMYHNYDADKMKALEEDPNKKIISRKIEAYDTVHMLPLHMDPKSDFMLYRTTYVYVNIKPKESPRQDTLTPTSPGVRVPKTRGGTDEFIRAFWINGKPKCRIGYSYDFNRKMCRLIK